MAALPAKTGGKEFLYRKILVCRYTLQQRMKRPGHSGSLRHVFVGGMRSSDSPCRSYTKAFTVISVRLLFL